MTKNAQRYIVHHETRYAYTAPVSQSWQLARLTPRTLPWQKLLSYSLEIEPRVDERRDETVAAAGRGVAEHADGPTEEARALPPAGDALVGDAAVV